MSKAPSAPTIITVAAQTAVSTSSNASLSSSSSISTSSNSLSLAAVPAHVTTDIQTSASSSSSLYVSSSSSSSLPSSNLSTAVSSKYYNFININTIKTWVASQYHEQIELMKTLQLNIEATTPQSPGMHNFIKDVHNDPNEKRYFGKSFPTIESIELPFLQFINAISKIMHPITLEIGAAEGIVSWKVPFAFEKVGVHYANELSHWMMDNPFESWVTYRLQNTSLKKYIVKLPGNCFDILTQNPALKGKVNAIFVQNVEHFFNPTEHQKFLTLIEDLLAHDGRAFLCAHSFKFGTDTKHPLYELFIQQKHKGDIYPGFAEYDTEFMQPKGRSFFVGEIKISNVSRPKDDAEQVKMNLCEPIDLGIKCIESIGDVKVMLAKQRISDNAFSPSIYRKAIESHASLEALQSFFINDVGKAVDKWGANITHAAAILRKYNKSSQLIVENHDNDNSSSSSSSSSPSNLSHIANGDLYTTIGLSGVSLEDNHSE